MSDNEKQFESFVRGIKFDDSPDLNHRDKLEQDLLAALTRQTRQEKDSRLIVWRRIMKSPITKLSSAALIIIAVTVGIMHFGTSIDGSSVVWAEAIKNIEEANSAIFREKRTFTCDGKQLPFPQADAVCYYSSEYGERDDMYSTEGVLLHQIYWLRKEKVRIRVIPPLKQYERTEFNEAERAFWEQPSIKAIVELSKSEKPMPLGRKMINGREAEGFETSEMAALVPLQVDRGAVRCWIDIETGLPIQYETEFLTRDKYVTLLTDGKPVLVQTRGYESKWNVEIEPSIFEPNIPPDYLDIGAIKSIPTVHIFGRDWDNKQIEMWVQVNTTKTGLLESCYIDHIEDGKVTVSTPEKTFLYDKKTNTVRIKDGPSVSSMFRLGAFAQGMERISKKFDGQVTRYEVFDPRTKRNVVKLKMTSTRFEIESLIDPETERPISIHVVKGERPDSYEIIKRADRIHYDDSPPEDVFDFKIPAGANIVNESIEDPAQNLPKRVCQYCVQFLLETKEEATSKGIFFVNTQIYLVDKEFNWRKGGIKQLHNHSKDVWTGEVGFLTSDGPDLAVFDENGEKQQVRIVQESQFSPGKFHLYWKLEEPLLPGQTRVGMWWGGGPRKLRKKPSDATYPMRMSNSFGWEAVENFILILPTEMKVRDYSRDYLSYQNVDGYDIYIWQRHLPKHRIANTVDVSLAAE